MITIYNQTSESWGFENKGKVSILRKEVSKRQGNKIVTNQISLLTLSSITADSKLIRSTKSTEKLVQVSKDATRLVYSNKEFSPVIARNDRQDQPVLLLSITKKRNSDVRIAYKGAQMVEYINTASEFSAVVNFTKAGDKITIYVKKSSAFIAYAFELQADGTIISTSTKVPEEEYEQAHSRFLKFRPHYATYRVYVRKDLLDKVKQLGLKGNHEVLMYENQSDLLEKLEADRENGYRAVTIYCDTTYRKETKQQRTEYNYEIINAKRIFDTVIKLHRDGKVDRVQLM